MPRQSSAGDCLLTNIRLKDVDTLDARFAQPVEKDGYLLWTTPEWLRTLRKQVQFNHIPDPTAWIWKD